MDPLASTILGGDMIKGIDLPMAKQAMDIMGSAFRMPAFMRAFVTLGSPMVWVDFLYHFVVDLIYRVVRASFTGGRPEAVFYATMYDFEVYFIIIPTMNLSPT